MPSPLNDLDRSAREMVCLLSFSSVNSAITLTPIQPNSSMSLWMDGLSAPLAPEETNHFALVPTVSGANGPRKKPTEGPYFYQLQLQPHEPR